MWSPLAGGLLSGKYRRGQPPPEGSRQLTDWGEPPVYDTEGLYDIIEVLVKVAEQRGVSAAQVALAYTLAKPAVTSLVIGARTDEQLADNLAAASLTLSDDERAQLDAVSAPPLLYPLLAPGQDRPRPPVARRPDPPGPPPEVIRVRRPPAPGPAAAGLRPRAGGRSAARPPGRSPRFVAPPLAPPPAGMMEH